MKRILIVDDSLKWVRYHETAVREIFKDEVSIDIAQSAKEGVEKLMLSIDEPYGFILTDMQMETDFLPDFAGEWLVKQIKTFKDYAKTPVVIISATYNIAFVAHTLGVKYLSKRTLVNNPDTYYFMLDENLV